MYILAFEYNPSTQFGGSERSYFDVLTGLQARGHQVVLHHIGDGNLVEKYRSAGVITRQGRFSYVVRPGHRAADLRKILGAMPAFREFRGKPAVIYLNFAEALPFALLLKLRFGFSIVCHIRIGYFGLSRQILWAGRFADRLIVINKKFRETFAKAFGNSNVAVIYNGVPIPAVLQPPVQNKLRTQLRILYLGRIAPEKGVIELVQAVARVIRAGVPATLQITGDFVASHSGDYKLELGQAIAAAEMGTYVTFSPPVDDPMSYMRGFDLFVMPATWSEPFGRTVPESILAGVPVLARNVGMMDEIMPDNPHFLFETDEELVLKIIAFFRDELIFNFEGARRRIVEEFNKDRMVEEVEQTLKDVSR